MTAEHNAEYVRAATTCLLCEVSYYCEIHDADLIRQYQEDTGLNDGEVSDR